MAQHRARREGRRGSAEQRQPEQAPLGYAASADDGALLVAPEAQEGEQVDGNSGARRGLQKGSQRFFSVKFI